MRRFKILFIKMSFLGLAFQGCGGGAKPKKSYPTAIGSAVSLTVEEERANNVTLEVAKLVKNQINKINEEEATSFSKTTNYCDISGVQEEELFGTINKITKTSNYQSCKNDNTIQNGDTIMTYENTDDDGKFPTTLELQAQNDYNFNNITLREGATIECQDINYNKDKTVESMIIVINGTVEYNSKTYTLENHHEIINF
jgi:hypothetical protein